MAAYIVSRVSIADHAAMTDYMAEAPATVEAYGGKYLVRTPDIEVLEGEADYNRMVVLEFPDRQSALDWYHSEDYRDLRQARWRSASAHIVLLPGEMV